MTAPVLEREPDAFDEPFENPGEFLDEVEVERLMHGDITIPLYRGRPHTAEMVEAVRRLAARDLTDMEISQRFHGRLSEGAVFKVRVRHGISAGVPSGIHAGYRRPA